MPGGTGACWSPGTGTSRPWRPPGTQVVLLRADRLDDQAREAGARLDIDWLAVPFTRCMVDNAALRPAGAHHTERVPPQSRPTDGQVRTCPACGRVYWPGGHVRRMQARLAAWQGTVDAAPREGQAS